MAGCDWSDCGCAGCAGWNEIASNVICTPFSYFLNAVNEKHRLATAGREKPLVVGGHHFNNTTFSLMFLPTSV